MNTYLSDNHAVLKTAIDNNGKIVALSAAYLADLSGANVTGVAKIAAVSTYTAGKQNFNGGANVRVVAPVGADKWGT